MLCKSEGGCKVTWSRENPVLHLPESSGDRRRGDERYHVPVSRFVQESMHSGLTVKHPSNDKRSTDKGNDLRVKEVRERRGSRVLKSPWLKFDRVWDGTKVGECMNQILVLLGRRRGRWQGERKKGRTAKEPNLSTTAAA